MSRNAVGNIWSSSLKVMVTFESQMTINWACQGHYVDINACISKKFGKIVVLDEVPFERFV